MKKIFRRICILYKNFIFQMKNEGLHKALHRVFAYSLQNKYIKLFFVRIHHGMTMGKKRIKKCYRKKIYITHREMRLRAVHINPNEAKNQVNKLQQKIGEYRVAEQPLVSIIVLNRNGLQHLQRFVRTVKKNTFYNNYEIIIIDNDSTDESIKFLEKNEYDLPIKLIKNKENVSFSRGCNQGAQVANGELFVFMNNDIQPLVGWLSNMVSCYLKNKEKVGSIGAKLIYPEKKDSDFMLSNRLQHVGIKFEFDYDNEFYRPYNFGNGENVLNYDENHIFPALTAALLMIPRNRFYDVGGFDEQYFYGYEDVDLGLKLTDSGYDNILCSNTCAFHYEFGTQETDVQIEVVERRKKNIDIFKKKWNQYLVKNIFLNKLLNNKFFCEELINIVIVVDKQNNVDEEILKFKHSIQKQSNWNVEFVEVRKMRQTLHERREIDILMSASQYFDIYNVQISSPKLLKIALPLHELDDWEHSVECLYGFDYIVYAGECDDILDVATKKMINVADFKSYDNLIKYLIQSIVDESQKSKISIKIATDKWSNARKWGDYYFALALKKYFERFGWSVIIQILPEWDSGDSDCDAILVLRGLETYEPKKHQFNIMWNISHPDDITIEEYEEYDHVFIASQLWINKIKKEVEKVDIDLLLQCTDHEVFNIPTFDELMNVEAHQVLFVGNSLRRYRESVKYAIKGDFNISIYGTLWGEFVDDRYIKGEGLPNDELYKYYNKATVLLNDHWKDMAEKGFVSNRVFDGLACGAVILTDDVRSMPEDIQKYLTLYKTENDFLDKLNDILTNNDVYKKKVCEARNLVIQKYSFEARVKQIIDVIESKC